MQVPHGYRTRKAALKSASTMRCSRISTVRLAATRLAARAGPAGLGRGRESGLSTRAARALANDYDWRAEEATLNRFASLSRRGAMAPTSISSTSARTTRRKPAAAADPHARLPGLVHAFPQDHPDAHRSGCAWRTDAKTRSTSWCRACRGVRSRTSTGTRAGCSVSTTLWHELMTEVLGYERYAAHGGDWGSTITEHIARTHAGSVVGIHLTDVPFWHSLKPPDDLAAGRTRVRRTHPAISAGAGRLRA